MEYHEGTATLFIFDLKTVDKQVLFELLAEFHNKFGG